MDTVLHDGFSTTNGFENIGRIFLVSKGQLWKAGTPACRYRWRPSETFKKSPTILKVTENLVKLHLLERLIAPPKLQAISAREQALCQLTVCFEFHSRSDRRKGLNSENLKVAVTQLCKELQVYNYTIL